MATKDVLEELDRAERERRELLTLLEKEPEEVLARSPAAGAWSALQVVSHLIQAESLSLGTIRKRLPDAADYENAGLGGCLRSTLLKVVLRSGWKVRAPSVVSRPLERDGLGTAREEWDEVRDGWRRLAEEFPEDWSDKAIYTHPRVGRLNLRQAVAFTREHVRHHRPQIERALAAARDPR